MTITDIYVWRHGETNANTGHLTAGGSPELYPNFPYCAAMTALNEQGKKQADNLGSLLVKYALDVIYTSDMGRARDTAVAVVNAYRLQGRVVDLNQSMQLREIIHGKYDLISVKDRNEKGKIQLIELLKNASAPTDDKFLVWKLHALVPQHEIVNGPCMKNGIVDVKTYIERKETQPETPWLLFNRISQEITQIAQANLGKKVGISSHGAALETLLLGLDKTLKGTYLPPYYNQEPIYHDDKMIPASIKVKNCDLLHLRYNSDTGELAFIEKITV